MKRTLTLLATAIALFAVVRKSSNSRPDVTVVVLNWVRLPNVVKIVSTLCAPSLGDVIKEIVVWNNNFNRPLVDQDFAGSPCSKLSIRNSPENLYFQARFVACANASTPYCFIQDDDYLVKPEIVTSLRARINTHDIFHLPPDEFISGHLLSIQSPLLDFGFSWLGYGAMILRSNAQSFLALLDTLQASKQEKQMADNYFTILKNEFPEIWTGHPISLFGGGDFTVGEEGVARNRKHIAAATSYLDHIIASGNNSWPYVSLAPSSPGPRLERAPCLERSCVLESTLQFLPDSFHASDVSSFNKAADLFTREAHLSSTLIPEFSSNYTEHSLSKAVDANPSTSFRSLKNGTIGDTLTLDILDRRRLNWTNTIQWVWMIASDNVPLVEASKVSFSTDQRTWVPDVSLTAECRITMEGKSLESARYFRLHLLKDFDQRNLGKSTDDYAYHLTAHLRLNAIYWGLTALFTMGHPEALDKEEVIAYIQSCWDERAGGFGAHPGHDAHIHATLSAIQILVMYDALDRLDIPRVVNFILSLQQSSGVFAGDQWGELDTRFSYIAVNALSLIGCLDQLDKHKTADYIRQCKNFDGGFGNHIGAESHAAMALSATVFPCVAALTILDRLDIVDRDALAWWLSERQLPNGGLNGRPEKLEDVCYSFWVLSALAILQKVSWIDSDKLTSFILSAQDPEKGGISDRPGNVVDVFHTQFGIAGLSLLGYPGLSDLDPVYCMPAKIIEAKGLRKEWKGLDRRSTV
ncbi:rab geranylgeranyltransferase [Favolaschia claudopus]|uniref:Geranylgeranyl transferase type-2 subunit beta n=1 Tax=Favolaschia claudopus TaxID=2862362 RepID=A0AAW0ECZ5_9AGAR